MTFLGTQTITRAIIFILRFKNENSEQGDDFFLTENLSTFQLHNLHNIFQEDRDHLFSRFKAKKYDLEGDDLVLREIINRHQNRSSIQQKHNCNCLICFGIDGDKEFREIHITVSKALFLKVINFSPGQNTILSTREVYDIIYNLFMILDNTNVIACVLLKQLLADEGLFETLRILHQENVRSVMINYQGTLEAKNIEMRNQEDILHIAFASIHRIAMEEFVFVYKDEHNNVASTTLKGDNKRKPHVVVDINLRDLWKSFSYLEMDLDFLGQNYFLFQKLLQRNSLLEPNVTLDIDFNGLYQRLNFVPRHIREVAIQSRILETLLPGISEHVNAFRLRLSEISCSIDFRFLEDKETTLFCSNLLFTSAAYLPQNLKYLYIHDSGIEGILILPDSMEVLSLKKVIIDKDAKLIVNDGCLTVEIEETVGDIDFPASFSIDALSFNKRWKKFHILRNNTGVIEELSIIKAELFRDWVINMGVKKIYLKHIKTEGIFRITINADCEKLSLKKCKGAYNLTENILLANFGQIEFLMGTELHLLNENGEYKLNIQNIRLATITSLNEKIKTIVLENVYIQRRNVFPIHIGCRNITLRNCRGYFRFFFGANLREIRRLQLCSCFSLQFNEDTGKYKMSLINADMDVSWILWDKLEELHLESIINESNRYFNIKEGCNNIKLLGCKGHFKVPGIQNANQGILKLNISTNELSLTKLQENLFLLHMSNIFIHQAIHVHLSIKSARLEGIVSYNNASIEFKAGCEILCLINCNVLFDQLETNIYERIILSKMFEISLILKAHIKELFINNCTITKDVQLCNTLYKLHLYDVKVLKKNTVTIPEQCMNIIVKRSFGAFLIPGLNEHENGVTIFFERVASFHFSRYKGSNHYLLKIDNCDINGRICIRKEIKYAIISNITCESTRPEENVDERTILMTESLHSLTLKSSPFLYNATIHRELIHLHLERMYFNHDVIIGDSIKKLTIKDLTVKNNSSVMFGKNISSFEIYNYNGVVNFNGLLNFKQLCFFGDEKMVYEKELQSGSVHLKIENLTFDSDYHLPEEINVLHLTRIKTKGNSKILVNKACEKIVTNFEAKIYFIEEKNIEEAVFINFMPLFETSYWTFSALHCVAEIKTPSHLKSIKFENIELRSVTIIVNESCEEISIVHCDCKFNLIYIQRLSKLTLHSGGLERPFLTFPDLSYIEELDLAFDFMLDFFELFLCGCFNAKILTLRALSFIPNDSNWRGYLTSDVTPLLAIFENCDLKQMEIPLNENFSSEENRNSLWILLNEKMNVLLIPIFNTRSQLKLEVLKIVGFYLSDKNLERISNFSIMRKLSVDYNFVSTGLFDHLPPNLETFEILSSNIVGSDSKNSMKNEKNAKSMKNISGPKMLIIEGIFFATPDNFSYIPQNLHSLKISYHDMTSIVYEPSIEKICLRELIIFFKQTKNNGQRFGLTSIEKKICMQEMLRYLSDFIDFSRLDSLMVEDGGEKTEYDRFEIY